MSQVAVTQVAGDVFALLKLIADPEALKGHLEGLAAKEASWAAKAASLDDKIKWLETLKQELDAQEAKIKTATGELEEKLKAFAANRSDHEKAVQLFNNQQATWKSTVASFKDELAAKEKEFAAKVTSLDASIKQQEEAFRIRSAEFGDWGEKLRQRDAVLEAKEADYERRIAKLKELMD